MKTTDELSEKGSGLATSVAGAADREEFWADTCREVTHMHVGSAQVRELYREFGCRFETPTHEQVQSVLSALDSAMPGWDKTYPRLFYETMQLNFPELLRRV